MKMTTLIVFIILFSIFLILFVIAFVWTIKNHKFTRTECMTFLIGIIFLTSIITSLSISLVNIKKEASYLQTWTEISESVLLDKYIDIRYLLYTDNKDKLQKLLNNEIIIKDDTIYNKERELFNDEIIIKDNIIYKKEKELLNNEIVVFLKLKGIKNDN